MLVIQLAEQAVELLLDDLLRSLRLRGPRGNRGTRRIPDRCLRLLAVFTQLRHQLWVRGLGEYAQAHLGHHRVDGIKAVQHDIHQVGIDLALVLAKHVEHVFRDMTDLDQRRDTQKPRAAFDRMEAPKDGVEQLGVVRHTFQVDQLLAELVEDFRRLHQKVLQNLVAQVETHDQNPRLDNNSSTSSCPFT